MRIGVLHPSQRASLVDLLLELSHYYDATGTLDADEVASHLDELLTARASPITLVTAQHPEGRVVGLAALILLPSVVVAAGARRMQCQLKELFVSDSCRGDGVGEALLRWCAKFALDNECGRMDWNVKAGNAAGIRFYERHGAQIVGDRLSYRVAGETLSELATSATS